MNRDINNLEYKTLYNFKDWASWQYTGEGVYGVTQSPEGTRGIVVRNPISFVDVYVLKDELDQKQEKEALSLIVRKNRIFDRMGKPPTEEFNGRKAIKHINKQLLNYLLDCYTELYE